MHGNTRIQGARPGMPSNLFFAVVLLILGAAVITACSTAPDPRKEAVGLYRYQGLRDELIVEGPKLSASMVKPDETITVETKITLLSPQKEKRFKVTEVTTLLGPDLTIELQKQETERGQGSNVSSIKIKVPKELPSGTYTLVATVATEEQQVKKKGTFKVERQLP